MTTKKTGIFYVKDPAGVIVMDQGIEIARYESVLELVKNHKHGLHALKRLEEQMEKDIASQYTPYPPE